jgi:DNA-binding winged helix-turn-helix (wHTH) protein/TolB-like protein
MEMATDGDGLGPVSRFGPFTLDAGRAELQRNGATVALRPKTFALLSYFTAHPGRVVSKGELLAAVWPGVVVNDESLSQCVRELRGALGDEEQALIRTVPRRGYLFDVPTETVTRAAGVDRASSPPRFRAWPLLGLVVLLVVLAAAPSRDAPAEVDDALKARRSVAVLPFAGTASAAQGRVAEEITASVVSALAKVPDTRVVAGAGREPGARHRLTGSAQQNGDRIRVHAQLESEDGAVDWSELFEYPATPADAWQRDVSLRIARAVDWQLDTAAAVRPPTREGQFDPVDEFMRGRAVLRHAGSYKELERARAHFESVTAAAPGSAAAWTALAQSYLSEHEGGWNLGTLSLGLAERALARARAADPQYLPALHASGTLLAMRSDFEGALRIYQAVLARNPSDAWAHAHIAAVKVRLGQLEEVAAHANAALELGALETSLVGYSHLQAARAAYYLGDDAKALEHVRQSVAAGPCLTQLQAILWLASLDALNGRGQEARDHAREVLGLRPRFTISAWLAVATPVEPRLQPLRDRYFEGLAKAGLPE